ncbi:digeranylgeranylglycerophospholipid reductase [Rhodovulum iodosum]|uniref:Digeranylgeranylglycerophospholipid reductase n=1 Tax=Rhodovulum iodosum TaxID=68291 RepID=A0ABV3XYX6_9RHOB
MSVDVLVVGLGPAGAMAAAAAARAGARVLAVDRRAAPGTPVQCAEFVPAALGAETPAVRRAAVQEIAAMETYLGAAPPLRTPDFRGVMIDRAVFDAALVAEAEAAGAETLTGTALYGIGADGTVVLGDRVVHPRVLIGADGPRSTVGRLAGHANRAFAETRQITVPLLARHDATDIFLRPEIEGGYGWLFPRGQEANLGLGVVPRARDRLKPLLDALHAGLARQGRVGAAAGRLTGGKIPVGGLVGPLGRIGPLDVLLAGDATGLTHPITGAGIAAACLSGRMAGAAAAKIAAGRAEASADYAEELTDLYGPSLALAARRRAELVDAYAWGARPGTAELRRAWIAYPEYRCADIPTPAKEAKEPA